MTSLVSLFDHIAMRGEPVKLFAMIEPVAYLDESLTTSGKYFAVAGTLATLDQWKAFQEEWRPLIAGLKKPFHCVNRESRDLAVPLAMLMRKHTLLSCYAAFLVSDYRKIVPHEVRSLFGAEYQLGVQVVIGTFNEWRKAEGGGRISYFLERGHRGFDLASMWLNAICANEEVQDVWGVHTWGPATKADLPAHPPDAVSHYGAKSEENINNTHEFVKLLVRSGQLKMGLVGRKALEQYVPEMVTLTKQLRGKKAGQRTRKRAEKNRASRA